MGNWLKDLFGREKPIIAMAHIPALPGTPRYDAGMGIDGIVEKTRSDVQRLLEGGVDGIMFCNEDDRPYVFQASMSQVATMSRIVTELRPKNVPFGTDFLWDPMAALCIGAATGASFMREVLTGTYESDMGLWSPNAGEVLRLRRNIGAEKIRIFFNVAPEFCSPLGTRTLAQRVKSTIVSSLADGILVSGPMAGAEPDYSQVEEAKIAAGEDVPVLLNTGAKAANIADYLRVADGVIVGSSLKTGGYTWNPVELDRVKEFVARANKAR
jgi:uncharacterized protein